MHHRDIALLMDGIAPVLLGAVAKALQPLAARIEALEQQASAGDPALAELRRDIGEIGPRLERHVAAVIEALPKSEPVDVEAIERGIDDRFAALPVARDGKSVTLDDVRPLVGDAVASAMAVLPAPRDGRDVDLAAVKAMIDQVMETMAAPTVDREEVSGIVAAAVESAMAAFPKPADGKSVDADDVRSMVADIVAAGFAALPVARDGKDVDPEAVRGIVLAEVEKAVAALPKPKDGENVDPDFVTESIAASVAAALGAWPRPQDGKSVTLDDVLPVVEIAVGKAMATLPSPTNGKDGVGLAGALIDREGELALTLTDGVVVKLGRVIGKDGDRGLDGLGFDDLDVIESGSDFVLRFARGDQVKEWRLAKPTLADCYRGVWREGGFKKGDAVTWGGSLFIAQRDTEAKPETGDDWKLAVKRGRDGRDAAEPKPPATVKLK